MRRRTARGIEGSGGADITSNRAHTEVSINKQSLDIDLVAELDISGAQAVFRAIIDTSYPPIS